MNEKSNEPDRAGNDAVTAACPTSTLEMDPFEQLNIKVPRGTKLRIKRLALDQGGITMMAVFMEMLEDYERRRSTKR